eukprot:211859-Pelagomonas_calceolata.AAC.1
MCKQGLSWHFWQSVKGWQAMDMDANVNTHTLALGIAAKIACLAVWNSCIPPSGCDRGGKRK